MTVSEEDKQGYAKVEHKLQENAKSSYWGLGSVFNLFRNTQLNSPKANVADPYKHQRKF